MVGQCHEGPLATKSTGPTQLLVVLILKMNFATVFSQSIDKCCFFSKKSCSYFKEIINSCIQGWKFPSTYEFPSFEKKEYCLLSNQYSFQSNFDWGR